MRVGVADHEAERLVGTAGSVDILQRYINNPVGANPRCTHPARVVRRRVIGPRVIGPRVDHA
jgi:hypothetical protein